MGVLEKVPTLLTKPQAGIRTEARIGRLVDGMELWGPDLRALPSLEDQMARLDAVAGDPEAYAAAWCDLQVELSGAPAQLIWQPRDADDAEPALYCGGVACDDQHPERQLRSTALSEHWSDEDDTVRAAITRELLRRGDYSDNRPAPRRDVFAAMRAFMEHRGRLMINPDGKLELGGCWPKHRDDDRSEAQLDEALKSMTAIHRFMRRRKGKKLVERAIRAVGEPVSGWRVLEAKPPQTRREKWEDAFAVWKREDAQHIAVCDAYSAAQDGYFVDRPERPCGTSSQVGDTAEIFNARVEAQRRSFDEADAAAREKHNVDRLEEREGVLSTSSVVAMRRMLNTPAPDLAACAEKLQVAIDGGWDAPVLSRLLTDLRRFAAAEVANG